MVGQSGMFIPLCPTGRPITIRQVGQLFGNAYLRASTAKNAMSGFEKTGIWPLNPHIFPEEAYAASETTNRHASTNNEPTTDDDDIPLVLLKRAAEHENKGGATPSCSKGVEQSNKEAPSCFYTKDVVLHAVPSCSSEVVVEAIPGCFSELLPAIVEEIPSTSNRMCTPSDIIPVPQIKTNQERKISRNRGKTAVLTSSPYLKELKEKNDVTPKKSIKTIKRNVFTRKNKDTPEIEQNQRKKLKHDMTSKENITNDDDDDDDTECILCGGKYLRSSSGEPWISCSRCKGWAHEKCTAHDRSSDKLYICDLCE
ncbi:unnamed protein product [Phaedon cochleariae]|uniref:PHD-type domain-containing protein n=1 Tax=Phaedon cochleariae TaxID=80249 RepID=A0A9N9SHX4_PHACE|nr:unnamed protein product [Phaedon cochleariae]